MYNTVRVTLENQEFGQVSTSEVQVAQYLDRLHTVRLHKEDAELISFEEIVSLSQVDSTLDAVKNNQSVPTPLCKGPANQPNSRRRERGAQNHPSLIQPSII